jgi:hypothetical protein
MAASDKANRMASNPSRYELEQQLDALARQYQEMHPTEVLQELMRIGGELGDGKQKTNEQPIAMIVPQTYEAVDDHIDQRTRESVYGKRDSWSPKTPTMNRLLYSYGIKKLRELILELQIDCRRKGKSRSQRSRPRLVTTNAVLVPLRGQSVTPPGWAKLKH